MALIEAFKHLLGDTAVLRREEDLAGHIEDWRGRYRAPALVAALRSELAKQLATSENVG